MKGMESKKLLKRVKVCLVLFVIWFIPLVADRLLLHTDILANISGVGIFATMAVLLVSAVKTSNAWHMEAEESIEKVNGFLQEVYGGRLYCCSGEISEEEKKRNPLFTGHTVYSGMQIDGILSNRKVRYRELTIEDREFQSNDHNVQKVIRRFSGCSFAGSASKMQSQADLLIYSAGFYKITRLRAERRGYTIAQKMPNGIEIYAKGVSTAQDTAQIVSLWDRVVKELQTLIQAYETCFWYHSGSVEVYLLEAAQNKTDIACRMSCLETFAKYL